MVLIRNTNSYGGDHKINDNLIYHMGGDHMGNINIYIDNINLIHR